MIPIRSERDIRLCVLCAVVGAVVAVIGVNLLFKYGKEASLLFPLLVGPALSLETIMLLLKGRYM
jgi:hypothetical protein